MTRAEHRPLALVFALLGVACMPIFVGAASWTPTTKKMATSRWGHTATLLNSGKVLVFGYDGRPELFDPTTGYFWPTGAQVGGGYTQGTSATLLADGRVLAVSGTVAELYDPATGTFSPTGSPIHFRLHHTATRLPDGRVLVAGGQGADGEPHSTAELYDPGTGRFTRTGSLRIGRTAHAAVGLANGRVAVFGGDVTTSPGYGRGLASIEIYTPATGTFELGSSTSNVARGIRATPLLDGKILVSGEQGETFDVYDPATGLIAAIPREAPLIGAAGFSATPLLDGRVLLAGGYRSGPTAVAAAELYWPAQRRFTATASMTAARQAHTATRLLDGRVLVTGGSSGSEALASAECYQPMADVAPPPAAPLQPTPLGGRIAGFVRDASTSLPLSGVIVTVASSSGAISTFGKTDATGRYISDAALPPGTYFARTANTAGYVDEAYRETTCAGCPAGTGRPIPVSAGSTVSGIDFTLAAGARVAGTVRDASGAPIAFATVAVYDAGGRKVTSGRSDGTGAYLSPAGLPSGTYFARASGYYGGYVDELWNGIACPGCDVRTGTPITVLAPATTAGIDFSLSLGGRIAGIVSDTPGTPLAGVAVRAHRPDGSFLYTAWTASDGHYELGVEHGLPAGSYFLSTSNEGGYFDEVYDGVPCSGACAPISGTPVDVTAGATTAGIDFTLEATP